MNAGVVDEEFDPRSATVRERRLSLVPGSAAVPSGAGFNLGLAGGLGLDTDPEGRLPDFETTAVRRVALPAPPDPADDFAAWLESVRDSEDPEQGLLELRIRRGDAAVVGGALLTLARTSGGRGAGWEMRVFAIASAALLFARDAESLLRRICRAARDRLAEAPGLPEPEEHFALAALTTLLTQAAFEPNEVFTSYLSRVEDIERTPERRRALMRAAAEFCLNFETLERLAQSPVLLTPLASEANQGLPTLPDFAAARSVVSVDSVSRLRPAVPVEEPSIVVSQSIATAAVNLLDDLPSRPRSEAPARAPTVVPAGPIPPPGAAKVPVAQSPALVAQPAALVAPPAALVAPPAAGPALAAVPVAPAAAPQGAPVRAVPSEDPWAAVIAAAQVPTVPPGPIAAPALRPFGATPQVVTRFPATSLPASLGSAPVQALPGQALPGQALPGQALPGQALPVQARPAQARPLPVAPTTPAPRAAAVPSDPWATALAAVQARAEGGQPAPRSAAVGLHLDWPGAEAHDGETTSLVDDRLSVGPGGTVPMGLAVAALAAACGAVAMAVLGARLGGGFMIFAALWALGGIGLFADRRASWMLGVASFVLTGGFLLVQSTRVRVEWLSPGVLGLCGVASLVGGALLLHPTLLRRYRSSSTWLRTR